MRELEILCHAYDELKLKAIGCVVATVVRVQGSSYRQSGARMLVDQLGNITGAISGGCLEGDALQKSLYALHQKTNKLVRYDTSDEDDAVIGAQLGCNGIIDVLIEYLDFNDPHNPVELLKLALGRSKKVSIGVLFNPNVFETQLGTSIIYCNGKILGSKILAMDQERKLLGLLENCHQYHGHQCLAIDDDTIEGNLFVQEYLSAIQLVIVGAGNDAQKLSELAELLGWKVIITDGRSTHANGDRFSSSCQIIVARPEESLQHITFNDRTCIVLMSHNYNYDLAILQLLLNHDEIPYIGILGPRKKYDRMLKEIKLKSISWNDNIVEIIHAPIGLDIGAETPIEIALSIVSEIQSVLTGSNARPLKYRSTPIHSK